MLQDFDNVSNGVLKDGIWLVTSPHFANLPLSVDDNFISWSIQRYSPPMFIYWIYRRIIENSRGIVNEAATMIRILG